MRAIPRQRVLAWLLAEGFVEVDGKAGGHRHFVKHGTKVSIAHHGRPEVAAKHIALIARMLQRIGYVPAAVKRALLGGG